VQHMVVKHVTPVPSSALFEHLQGQLGRLESDKKLEACVIFIPVGQNRTVNRHARGIRSPDGFDIK
jgi:hypothetical protein